MNDYVTYKGIDIPSIDSPNRVYKDDEREAQRLHKEYFENAIESCRLALNDIENSKGHDEAIQAVESLLTRVNEDVRMAIAYLNYLDYYA